MILQNGKRIDGCSDTVPVGTLQPYLGLVPPKGYLVCQGQLVSKITYSKLYEICGDTFGTSTETHFYLPDLRGKTLAGYDENDTTMNTIGKLIGQKTHIHTTGNHTLTTEEIPEHNHHVHLGLQSTRLNGSPAWNTVVTAADEGTGITGGNIGTQRWSNATNNTQLYVNGKSDVTGGSQAHNHGDTGSNTNYQPTITINWIVKAVMLIPDYIIVEDTLNSDSAVDALSARQGKLLNEKFTDYATKSEMIQYLPLAGGTMLGEIVVGQHDGYGIQLGTNGRINATINNDTRCTVLGMMDDKVVVGHDGMPLWMRGSNSAPLYNGTLLVESGSNSKVNGVKFIDGTLICTRAIPINGVAVDNPWGDALYYYENNDIYDFPQAFIDTPYNFQMTFRPSTAAGGWLGNYSVSSVTSTGFKHFAILRPTINTVYGHIYVTAVGRWK